MTVSRAQPMDSVASLPWQLACLNVLCDFSPEERLTLASFLEIQAYPAGAVILREHEMSRDMYFVMEGECALRRAQLDLGLIGPGRHFGELGLITGRPRAATVIARTPMTLARLSLENYHRMLAEEPELAVHLMQALVSILGLQLTDMTDSLDRLLQKHSLPRHATVRVTMAGETRQVQTGTLLSTLLPEAVAGDPVVAALLNNKAVSASSQLFADSTVEPLTARHWEGERIYRRSAALLLLEAAAAVAPELEIRAGVSMGHAQWFTVAPLAHADLELLSQQLTAKMQELVAAGQAVRREGWSVEEAIRYFQEHDQTATAQLLRIWRNATVSLVSCGQIYVLAMGPLLANLGQLGPLEVLPTPDGLLLTCGEAGGSQLSLTPYASVMHEHELWLKSLDIDTVGKFNQACIEGRVAQTIRVAEGFHEKRIGRIADAVAARQEEVRIICIAGPSSSGKTTFIKRLTTQLQVNGLEPLGISLDDYYTDRERCPRDAQGEYDFEALEALDLPLLREQLGQLLQGQPIRTARFDFQQGRSFPQGGPELHLGPKHVLLLEGLHGLNPELLEDTVPEKQLFRIFIQPMTSLPFDQLSRVNPSDLRLLRRIVRDRHQRGTQATDNILRWPAVREGERRHIYPFVERAHDIFDTSLIYEISVLKVYAERYLLEVPRDHPAYTTAYRLRQLIDYFVAIYPEHVPPTSILREFIGGG